MAGAEGLQRLDGSSSPTMYLTGIIKGVARHCYAAPSVDPNWMWQYGIRNANKWIPCGRKNPLPFLSCLRSLPSALKVSQKGNGSPKRVETIGVYPFGTPAKVWHPFQIKKINRLNSKLTTKRGKTMRALVQRVSHASVTIDGRIHGQIGQGFLVLLGIDRKRVV